MTYGPKFDKAYKMLLANEGGWAKLSGDPGGRTWYGVSETYQPQYFKRMVAAQSAAERLAIAKECYHREYWTPLKCDDWPIRLAFRLLDMSALRGVKNTIKALQQAANIQGSRLLVDGVLGPLTYAAVLRLANRYERNLAGWTTYFFGQQLLDLATKSPDPYAAWIWGWGARLLEPEVESEQS